MTFEDIENCLLSQFVCTQSIIVEGQILVRGIKITSRQFQHICSFKDYFFANFDWNRCRSKNYLLDSKKL